MQKPPPAGLNGQPIEKSVTSRYAGELDIHSIFYTIQGEGPFSGHPALFIRLAGCNLQCPWCDTEYTEGRQTMPVDDIIQDVLNSDVPPRGLIVITGGEPFRQNLTELIVRLTSLQFYVQIETNGTLPAPPIRFNKDVGQREGAYIVCSPKTGKVSASVASKACCFKYVLDADAIHPEDGLPLTALGHTASPWLARPPENVPVYLQPADHKNPLINERNLQAVVASCMRHGYTLQLQIHKYLGLE